MKRHFEILTAAAAALTTTAATSQVVITEVHPTESWIEIQNRGSVEALMGNWSVLCTTRTPGMPNTYWWAFPSGTTLAPGAFARIHWYQPYQAPTSTDFYTGNHLAAFLFGLGGEPLQADAGSVALLGSQAGETMTLASIHIDWLTWGEPDAPREEYAVAANLWVSGTAVPAPAANESIALGADPSAEPTPPSEYFLDSTPSPNAPNNQGSAVDHFGLPCAVGFANPPSLEALGIPAIGNADFTLRIHGVDPWVGQSALVMLSFGQGTGQTLPIPQFTCPFWIDVSQPPLVALVPATPGQLSTDLRLPLTSMTPDTVGWVIYAQAIVAVMPPTQFDHASSAGIAITIGG